MKLIKVRDYGELSKKAGEIVVEEIKKKPNLVLGLASGRTTLGLYKNLVKAYKKKQISFSKVGIFNLDEYYPIKKRSKKSFYDYFYNNLFNYVDIKKPNINLLNPETKNPKKECEDYERKIKRNSIDLQILGLGVNGHIGFNEPGSLKNSKTRLVELSEETRKVKKLGKSAHALTMGIGTILKAKKIILLASGRKKAEAIKHLIKDKPDSNWPVSYLRRHKDLIVIVDRGACPQNH